MRARFVNRMLGAFAFVLLPIGAWSAYISTGVPPGGSSAPAESFAGRTINVTDFGAKCDASSGNGTMYASGSIPAYELQTSGIPHAGGANVGKPIVVTGAANWSLVGTVSGPVPVIYNVSYAPPGAPPGTFVPSLIGVAGGYAVSDSGTGGAGRLSGARVAKSNWTGNNYPATAETGTAETTGTTSKGTSTVTLATLSPPLVGLNGQVVMATSASPLTIPIVADTMSGMPVSSSSGDIPAGTIIQSVNTSTNQITMSNQATANNANETIFIGGYIMVVAGTVTGTGITPNDALTIPGAPLAAYLSSWDSTNSAWKLSTSSSTFAPANAVDTVPSWVATEATINAACSASSCGYVPGDFVVIGDGGTVLQIQSVDSNGSPTDAQVYAQLKLTSQPVPPYNVVQTSSMHGVTGSTGPSFTTKYTTTGQFWYGTDDSSAINLALAGGVSLPSPQVLNVSGNMIYMNSALPPGIVIGMSASDTTNTSALPGNTYVSAFSTSGNSITVSQSAAGVLAGDYIAITGPQLPQGSDIRLPAERFCGVANTVNLPSVSGGMYSLRAWDPDSSGMVALAQMPSDSTGASYVVRQPGTPSLGGGMRDVGVEANKLALYGIGVTGGEGQTYFNDHVQDAIGAEWLCGQATTQIDNTIFDHIRGDTVYENFGPIALMPMNDILVQRTCEGEQFVHSFFRGGWVPIFDNQTDYNLYLGDDVDSIEPFNPTFCAQLSGHQTLVGLRCLNVSKAGVYISGSSSVVTDIHDQFNNSVSWNGLLDGFGVTYGAFIAAGTIRVLVDGVQTEGSLTPNTIVYQEASLDSNSILANNPGSSFVAPGPGFTVPAPQGRLTLQSGSPVMNQTKLNVSTIYYDCFTGTNVPFFTANISNQLDSIAGCETSLTIPSGFIANDIFDVWWWDNGGAPVLCAAANTTSKAGWTGDSGGTLNHRGSGYTQLFTTSGGYITNQNSFVSASGAGCYNGSNEYVAMAPAGTIGPKQLTYLGSFYTTAAGETSFNPVPGPATQAQIGICNAYNKVPVSATSRDAHAAYTVVSTNWELAGYAHSGINNILALDCLQNIAWDVGIAQPVSNGGVTPELSIALVALSSLSSYAPGSTCGGPTFPPPNASTSQQSGNIISVAYSASSLPLLGMTCAQAIEFAGSSGPSYFHPTLQIQLPWQY